MTESISTKSSLQETHLTQINYQTVWPNYHFFIGGTVSLHFLELFAHRFSTAHYRNRRDISGAGWPTFFSVVFIPPHKAKRAVWRLARWTGGDRAETLDWLRHSLVDRCLKVRRHQLLIWWCYLIRINSSSCCMWYQLLENNCRRDEQRTHARTQRTQSSFGVTKWQRFLY